MLTSWRLALLCCFRSFYRLTLSCDCHRLRDSRRVERLPAEASKPPPCRIEMHPSKVGLYHGKAMRPMLRFHGREQILNFPAHKGEVSIVKHEAIFCQSKHLTRLDNLISSATHISGHLLLLQLVPPRRMLSRCCLHWHQGQQDQQRC